MAKKTKQVEKREDWSWHSGRRQAWVPGVILIAVGVVFLAQNYWGFQLTNWWALFILIPAISSISQAVESYQQAGSFDRKARGHAFWGLFFILLSATFVFGWSFGLMWPVFLILGGLAMLLGML